YEVASSGDHVVSAERIPETSTIGGAPVGGTVTANGVALVVPPLPVAESPKMYVTGLFDLFAGRTTLVDAVPELQVVFEGRPEIVSVEEKVQLIAPVTTAARVTLPPEEVGVAGFARKELTVGGVSPATLT